MKTKVPSLASIENYRKELKLQVENIIVGKSVTKSLAESARQAFKDIDKVPEEIKKALTSTLTTNQGISDSEVSTVIHGCERALKLRQAIKICSDDGRVYWMWKLQPGEKIPDNYEIV